MQYMITLLEELKKQALHLTTQEKAILARFLIVSLDDPNADDTDQLWVAESRRRYQAYSKGEIEAYPGDQVMTRTRNRLKKFQTGLQDW